MVTGASHRSGLVKNFLGRGYSAVGSARNIIKSGASVESDKLAWVDGDIGESATAATIAQVAMRKFGSIDALIKNAGIFIVKLFIDYKLEDFKAPLRPTRKASSASVSSRELYRGLSQGGCRPG
ncbi:MAG: SDR family NAD(P)-dependent oxidoreductase [Candidatus Binataceae bacterium]